MNRSCTGPSLTLAQAVNSSSPFSIFVGLDESAEPSLHLVPFLGLIAKPGEADFISAGQELLANSLLMRAFSELGLTPSTHGLRSIPVPIQEPGISEPSNSAMRRALEIIRDGDRTQREQHILCERFLKWTTQEQREKPLPCLYPCAQLKGSTSYETWLALSVILRNQAELLTSESQHFLRQVSPFFEALEDLYAARKLEIVSGVETAAAIFAPSIRTEGYLRASSSADPAKTLKRIFGSEKGNHWHLNALARNTESQQSRFENLLAHAPHAHSGGAFDGRNSLWKNSATRVGFLSLRVALLKELNSMWIAIPYLSEKTDIALFWQAVQGIETRMSMLHREVTEPSDWFVFRAVFVSALVDLRQKGPDPDAMSMEEALRWMRNRRVESITLRYCRDHLPTAHVGESVLAARLENVVSERENKVQVKVAARCPESELMASKNEKSALTLKSEKILTDLELGMEEGIHLPLPDESVYPFGKLMLLLQVQQLTRGLPQIFANPTALRSGEARVEPDWLSRHSATQTDLEACTGTNWILPHPAIDALSPDSRPSGTCVSQLPLPAFSPMTLDQVRAEYPYPQQVRVISEVDRLNARVSLSYAPVLKDDEAEDGAVFEAKDITSILAHLHERLKGSMGEQESEYEGSEGTGYQDVFDALDDLVLEPRFEFEVGDDVFSQDEWEQATESDYGYTVADRIFLSREEYESCLNVYVLRKKALARFGAIRISNLWSAMNLSRLESSGSVDPLEYVKLLKLNLEPLVELVNTALPKRLLDEILCPGTVLADAISSLRVTLRGYQRYGVAWVFSRLGCRLGALLADDMGLGKTLQAISVVALLYARNRGLGRAQMPTLILCPKSLLTNWCHEFQRFLPDPEKSSALGSLKVDQFSGDEIPEGVDVLVTTYSLFRRRSAKLKSVYPKWGLVILDEAHAIKNSDTKLATLVGQLQTEGRLALTGTPIENHAAELWSLMNWLNPGVLGNEAAFESYTRLARSGEDKAIMLKPVHEVLKPLLLRRVKSDPSIGLELPEKIERVQYISLSEEQSILYETVVLAAIDADVGASNPFQSRARFLSAIMRLKQICNHPDLFYAGNEDKAILEDKESVGHIELEHLRKQVGRKLGKGGDSDKRTWIDRSAKMQAFAETLSDLRENPAGVLIFTQFRGTADQAAVVLQQMGWNEAPILHGGLSTEKRQSIVSHFQETCQLRKSAAKSSAVSGLPPILILSLKAGGVGLNLSGANHVIHLDRWWNPAVEDQATDRAHRIGQDERVLVTHFCSEGTIEEGIQHRLDSKRQLAADLIGLGSQESLQDSLKDLKGFLKLVDPYGKFRGRRKINRTAHRVGAQEVREKQLSAGRPNREGNVQ